jgi:hypothetical protein
MVMADATSDFTVADVLAWARAKPAAERYNYGDPRNCALCHFLRDTGRASIPTVSQLFGWGESGAPLSARRPYPVELEPALVEGGTFGGLAKLLEAICHDTPVTQSDWAAIDAYLTDIEQVSA